MQPFGVIPILQDGDFSLAGRQIIYLWKLWLTQKESRAICRYIAEKYADQGTKLVPDPSDLKAAAKFSQWLSVENANWDAYASPLVNQKLFRKYVSFPIPTWVSLTERLGWKVLRRSSLLSMTCSTASMRSWIFTRLFSGSRSIWEAINSRWWIFIICHIRRSFLRLAMAISSRVVRMWMRGGRESLLEIPGRRLMFHSPASTDGIVAWIPEYLGYSGDKQRGGKCCFEGPRCTHWRNPVQNHVIYRWEILSARLRAINCACSFPLTRNVCGCCV